MTDNLQKTICEEFEEQLDISETLYKTNLNFEFTKADVKELLDKATPYSIEVRNRVETIVYAQMRKYKYLMR